MRFRIAAPQQFGRARHVSFFARPSKRMLWSLLTIGLALVAGQIWWQHRFPTTRAVALPDGSMAYFQSGTSVHVRQLAPGSLELNVDGVLFLRVPKTELMVRSRLLRLMITGPAEVRISARAKDTGEEVGVAQGG